MGARKRAGKGDRKPDGGSAGGPKAGNAGGIGAVGLALLVAGGAVAVWWVVGGSGGGSGGGGGGGDVGLFSRTRSEEMDRVDRLRTMIRQQKWSEITQLDPEVLGPTATASGPPGPLQAAAVSNGLVQMAVATRAYGQLLQANPLRELCTGCNEGSKADESAFIAAIRAVAQLSSEADLSVGLFAAIRARDLGATAALLEAGADPSAGFGPSDTTSPLHLAVSTATEFGALSKQLLQNDGTIDPELSSWMVSLGGQAFLDARKPGTVNVAELRPVINSWTKRFVDLLVGAGANPAIVDPLKRTPLHVAAAVGNTAAMVGMLAGRKPVDAALRAIDVTGQNPMDLAISHGFTDTAKVLGDGGAAPSPKRSDAYIKYYQAAAAAAAAADRVDVATRDDTGGGWYEPGEPPDADTMSNAGRWQHRVDVQEGLSQQDMFVYYYAERRPVLLKRAASEWGLRGLCKKNLFLKKFGKRTLPSSIIPYGDQYGLAKSVMGTLKQYISRSAALGTACKANQVKNGTCATPPYIFERDIEKELPELMDSVPKMPATMPSGGRAQVTPQPPQFYLGPAGSGAPVHFHGDAWNALMYGRKHWILFPPTDAKFSKVPVSEWVADNPDVLDSAHHVIQEAGDVLFVPRGWSHGVLNLRFSIGVAREFDSVFGRY